MTQLDKYFTFRQEPQPKMMKLNNLQDNISRAKSVKVMTCPTTACCVVTLNQQQQQNIRHYNHSADNTSVKHDQPKLKNCTVVEDGRVVVKMCVSSKLDKFFSTLKLSKVKSNPA